MAEDPTSAIAALEAALGRTPSTSAPYEHALLAHRLGVAYAEAGRPEGLHQARSHLERAMSLLDPRFHPVEHARVLTAAGAVRRSMGSPGAALELFERALSLAGARVGPDEAAAMANNVGLALLEVGERDRAVQHFDRAHQAFDPVTADGRRGRASAMHNRGLARAASGAPADLEAAIGDHDAALTEASLDDAPLHHGLIHHSRGVAAMALAGQVDGEADRWRLVAIESFGRSLDVFTWPEHRVQHAIGSFNLGRAWALGGETEDLRRALLCFEDAVTAFDPRQQAAPWRKAYAALETTEAELSGAHPGRSRADHLVALLGTDPVAAPSVVRGRLARWLPLPQQARATALTTFSHAALRAGGEAGTAALVALLSAAMELPTVAQEAVLDAILAVRAAAADDVERTEIDVVVDRMVGEAVVGPQRVFVRDHLVAGGFERP